jgi:bifunctional ADP-heptose synthase (sugar kinase/adenylyltransferase)
MALVDKILASVKERLFQAKGVILSDYGKGMVSARLLKSILGWAHRQGKLVTVDPKIEHFLSYRGVDCITPNLKEATEGIRAVSSKERR